jgi:CRP/FNR family transcriptional regulator, cyclic AMP receptor protein
VGEPGEHGEAPPAGLSAVRQILQNPGRMSRPDPQDKHARWGPLLRTGRWFSAIPDELAAALLADGSVRTFAAGARLFSRGDAPSGLYAVLEGSVRITATTEHGREALLTLVEPPAWFGEIAVFDRQPRTHDAIADEQSQVLHVPQAALEAILARDPHHWRELGLLVTSKLRLAFLAMEDMATLPVAARLARRLALMAEGYGEREGKRRIVEVRQEQLASMLSTSRQTVNQLLKELEGRGLVRLSYGQIEILDLEALRGAGGD